MNWFKYKNVYFAISALAVASGLYAVFSWGLPLGLDFTGGAVIEYKLDSSKKEALEKKFAEANIEVAQQQTSGDDRLLVKTKSLSAEEQQKIASFPDELAVEQLSLQNVGPTVGPELIKKTLIAIALAGGAILLWVATQFKKLTFGISAILATLHDSLVLMGSFAIFGHFFGAEIDFLFVTAVLTTLSFSVHDTIVVFDRIREIGRKHGGEVAGVANRAVSQTMRRSIVNSLTIIIMLTTLVIFGGDTIRWFAVALLVGAISGTYSSPFVAVPLYVLLEGLQRKFKKK